MFFDYSPEQQDFRSAVRKLSADRAALAAARNLLGDAHDAELWRIACAELAIPALAVPERYGGAGFGLEETAIAVAELGAALAPVPALEQVLAIEAIVHLGSPRQREQLLPALASGERIAVAAITDPAAGGGVAASQDGSGFALTGLLPHVPRAHRAGLLLVPAATAAGTALYLVDNPGPGVTVTGRERSFDLTRPVSAVGLDSARAVRLGERADPELDTLADVGRTLLAAEMTAAAQACLDMSVGYAGRRMQFNRAIGSFQAIKHGCAQLAVELDAARAAADWAVMLAAAGDPGLSTAALIAKAQAAGTFTACAGWNIQVHGGIGFTWEHDAHLYLRRAKADEVLFGDTDRHLALLADRAGI